jgi:hypothetical protein
MPGMFYCAYKCNVDIFGKDKSQVTEHAGYVLLRQQVVARWLWLCL